MPAPIPHPMSSRSGVAEDIAGVIEDERCAIVCQQQVAGTDVKSALPLEDKELRSVRNGGGGGNKTTVQRSRKNAKSL